MIPIPIKLRTMLIKFFFALPENVQKKLIAWILRLYIR
jgi:hypothetical protein